MVHAIQEELLPQALELYGLISADPSAHGPEASRLITAARAAGDDEALVAALRAEAWHERFRQRHQQAKDLLDEAVRLARKHRYHERLGEVLITRGVVALELGRAAAAERDFAAAERYVHGALAAELTCQRATLAHNLGRLAEAAALYERVLADPACPNLVRVKASNNLAIHEAQRGHPTRALALADQAARGAEQEGPATAAFVAATRAWIHVQAGRLRDGVALSEDAITRWERAGLPLGELHAEYADVLADLRLVPEAFEQAELAVRSLQRGGAMLMAAEAQVRAARLALLRGDPPDAAARATTAADELRRQRRPSWRALAAVVAVEARRHAGQSTAADLGIARRAAHTLQRCGLTGSAVDALLLVATLASERGRRSLALDALDRAAQLAEGQPVLVRLKGRVAAARAARQRGDDRAVMRHSTVGLADLARHRRALPSIELRALASGHGAELGALGLGALVRTGSPDAVFRWMERTRSAALSAVEPPDIEGVEDELAELRAVHAELAEAKRESGEEPPELLARQDALERRIRRATWTRAATTPTPINGELSTATVRRRLDGRVLVAFDVLDGSLLAAVVEARRTRLVSLGPVAAVRAEINALLLALRALCRPSSPARQEALRASAIHAIDALRTLLLEPLGLRPAHELVIVPVGDLQLVPWTALCEVPVAVSPSAAFWLRAASQELRRDGIVLVAGPDLAGAAAEVRALRSVHPEAVVLEPPDSTVDTVAGALAGAGLAHLSCHGRVRVDNPSFSSLVLCRGELTLYELHERGLAPDRIVLAACESGRESSFEGNESLGFVSALLSRGASGVVASLVVVPDRQTAPLMQRLHAALRAGASMPVALHQARQDVDRADPADFVAWCAFNAFGAA